MAPRRSPPATGKMVIFTLTYRYKNKDAEGRVEKKSHLRTKEMRLRVKPGEDVEQAVAIASSIEMDRTEADSPFFIVQGSTGFVINSEITIAPKTTNKGNIKMKDATALALDGQPLQTWDSKNNTCVYDFVIWRYKDLPGCKKICNYEALDAIFKSKTKIYYTSKEQTPWITDLSGNVSFPGGVENITFGSDKNGDYYIINDDYSNLNPRVDGVSTFQLNNLCDALGCRSYAFDEQNKLVNTYVPTKDNRKIPPLVYMIKDKHFFAITDRNKSVSQMGKHKTDMEVEKAKVETEAKALDVVILEESEKRPSEKLVEVMRQVGKQVFPFKNLQVDKNGIRAFTLDSKRYIFEEDESIIPAQKIAEMNERPYGGESTFTLLMKMLDELKYTHKSVFNPHTYQIMTSEGVKTRTHYGLTDEMYDVETLQALLQEKKAICADIAKCYTAVITEPMAEFFQYEFNDHWVGVKKQPTTFEPGLYYVMTNDMTLFHSTNIYSHTIIEKAKERNIPFTIVAKYIPTGKSLGKNYFAPLLKRIDEECKGDPQLKKKLTNIITGFLGKHTSERYVARMNTDAEVVWNDFTEEEFHRNQTFMYKVEEFYIYGYVVKQDFAENNIPMYIQILDQANIRLYNMIQESGGICAWRKTDCAVIVGGKLDMTTEANAKPGSYRPADFIAKDSMEKTADERAVELPIKDKGFKVYKEITHSGQTDEVYKILLEQKGLVNLSRAGTGKSYNVLEIEKKFKAQFPDAKIYKLAFTNKACLNIRGTTIHKFLKINKEGKLNLSWLNSLQGQNVLFMIDEVSMIGAYLWRRLVALKKAMPDAYFLLCGDFRQVPAVEAKFFDYSHCSALKYMASYNKIEFTKRQRYDEALWNFAEKIAVSNETDYTKVKTMACKDITPAVAVDYTNICYYNATRKGLNQTINEYVAKSKTHKIVLPFDPEDLEDDDAVDVAKDIQQDAIIYKGLPIIAHKNKKTNKNSIVDNDEDEMEMVNNENFVIDECDAEFITATSKRINDEGEEYEHTITFLTQEFHSRFLLNYCSTTHKSQGATIDNNILIWDYSAMTKNLRYTATTRAKKLSQINIVVSSI